MIEKSAAQIVQEFALAKLDAGHLEERATLYRALADLAPTPEEQRELRALAAATNELNARHRQLVKRFGDAAEE